MDKQSESSFAQPEEVAKTLGCTGKTVRMMLRRGEIPAIKLGGRWYISRVDRLLAQRSPAPRGGCQQYSGLAGFAAAAASLRQQELSGLRRAARDRQRDLVGHKQPAQPPV